MTRFDIINTLIKVNKYKRYLEIGVQNKECFNEVKCKHKKSVDPDKKAGASYVLSSDEYFNQYSDKYDIIFIDGLHHSDQALRDIKNALKVLNKDGKIVVHDCLPTNEDMQKVPRVVKEWTGNVWKAICRLRDLTNI